MPAASPPTHTRHAAPPHHSTSRALSTLWLVTPAPLPLLVVTAGHSLEMCKGHCSHQGQMRPTHCAPCTMLGLNDPRVSEFLSAVPSAPHAGPHARIQPSLAPSAPSSRRGVDRLEVFFSSFPRLKMRETEEGDGGRNPLNQARNLAQTGKETARRAQDFHFHPLCALWVSGLNRNPAQISKANSARRFWTSVFTWPSTFMRRRATHKWSAPALRLDTQWPCAGRVSMGLMSTVLDCLRAFADVREAGCHGLQ